MLGSSDGFEPWACVLAAMEERELSQGTMSRNTDLSYRTVKKYLKRLEEAG